MGRGGRGVGWPQGAAQAAREGAASARALAPTLRRQAPGTAGPMVAPSTARREPCAAPQPVVGTAPEPGGPRWVRRPWTPSEASCGEEGVDRQGLAARHVGASHPGAPGQLRPASKRRRGSGRWSMGGGRGGGSGMGSKSNHGRKGAEDTGDVLSAGRPVLRGKSIERQGWGARAARCRARIPRARLDHGVRPGWEARGARLGAGARGACASDERAEPAQPCHACPLTPPVVQGQRQVVQRLVQGRHRCDRPLEQRVARAEKTAELAEVLRRTHRRRQPASARQLVEPPTITASRLRTPRDLVARAGLDESARKATGCEEVTPRPPVHPGGGHHARGNPTGGAPVGEPLHVPGTGAPCLARLGIAIRGHTAPGLLSPHIDPCGRWMEKGHMVECTRVLRALCSPTCLRSGEAWGEEGTPGLLRCKDTRGGGRRRDCFILREPRRSVGGTLTTACSRRLTAYATLRLPGAAEAQR
jgi:hypothetical protein